MHNVLILNIKYMYVVCVLVLIPCTIFFLPVVCLYIFKKNKIIIISFKNMLKIYIATTTGTML
jgi:hypothetical protein